MPSSIVIEEDQRESADALVEEETPAEKRSLEQGSDSDITPIDSFRGEIDADRSVSNSTYNRKAKVVNKAMVDIGMGKYQWWLFCLCGMGNWDLPVLGGGDSHPAGGGCGRARRGVNYFGKGTWVRPMR